MAVLICALAFTGCEKKTETDFYASVVVNPSTAKAGDDVTLSIGPAAYVEDGSMGFQETWIPSIKSISYYVDGELVAEGKGSNPDWNYKAVYHVGNLTPGVHTVTAKCKSPKNLEIVEHITSGQLTVE